MSKRKTFGISKQLTQSISQTVEVARDNVGALRYEVVPLSRIELDPDNPRDLKIDIMDLPDGPKESDPWFIEKKQEKLKLDSLAKSIAEKGLINPVWIYKKEDRYRLIVGERRLLASKIAGKKDVPAKILDKCPDVKDLRVIQWIENVEREDLSLWERLQNIEMILNAYKIQSSTKEVNPSLIKNLLNCSLPHASNYFAVIYTRSQVKEAIKKGQINSLEKAALLASLDDDVVFNKMFEYCTQGKSLRALKGILKRINEQRKSLHIKRAEQKRGRRLNRVKLGYTKNVSAVKLLINLILKSEEFKSHKERFNNVKWDNFENVTNAFNQIMGIMEDSVSDNE